MTSLLLARPFPILCQSSRRSQHPHLSARGLTGSHLSLFVGEWRQRQSQRGRVGASLLELGSRILPHGASGLPSLPARQLSRWQPIALRNPRRAAVRPVCASGRGGGQGGGPDLLQNPYIANIFYAGVLVLLTYLGVPQLIFELVISFSVLVFGLLGLIIFAGTVFFLWPGKPILKNPCPQCGQELEVLELLTGVQVCPYCATPFQVRDKQFVRAYSKVGGTTPTAGGFGGGWGKGSSSRSGGGGGGIVDIEAEVKDKE